ncbi:MAG: DUF120 domain-containing protein [Candidatus Saliniplasma sp.]
MEREQPIKLVGEVVSGKEEGQYFLSKNRYREQFIDRIGIDPYEGTLNVELNEESVKRYQEIRKSNGTVIEGFIDGDMRLGDVNTFPAEIAGIKCALVIPEKSDYTETAEVISNTKLRKELGLEDGDDIEVLVWLVD